MTPATWNHIETVIQMVVGITIAQVVLWLFNVPMQDAVFITVIMTVVSYIRSYVIRSVFDNWRR